MWGVSIIYEGVSIPFQGVSMICVGGQYSTWGGQMIYEWVSIICEGGLVIRILTQNAAPTIMGKRLQYYMCGVSIIWEGVSIIGKGVQYSRKRALAVFLFFLFDLPLKLLVHRDTRIFYT